LNGKIDKNKPGLKNLGVKTVTFYFKFLISQQREKILNDDNNSQTKKKQ